MTSYPRKSILRLPAGNRPVQRREGTTLVEILLTLAILTTALFASMTFLVSTMRVMRHASRASTATSLVSGRLELMRVASCAAVSGSEVVAGMTHSWTSHPDGASAQLSDSIAYSTPFGDRSFAVAGWRLCQ